ncbi:protein FAM171B-like [Xyrichtys novacula]|uniref:Protein FAM171B-like n=1 Tax=Xyrichtys novacula TaxID=13765 RepID=A0AAV1GZ06_XYRNO|nr:protein FAM171B-like [Xyrichtys novacula]
MSSLILLLFALILRKNGDATSAEFTPTGRSVHINDGNFSAWDHMKQESIQVQQQVLESRSGSAFNLKVQVNAVLSRQLLSQATVEVYINYTRTTTALTGEDGGVLLSIPYRDDLPITIVASKDGYMLSLLPYKASRMPLFSSVTVSLLRLNQGNVWLFDDLVKITGKNSDASSLPVVQFPKSLLNLTDSGTITAVKAFLTIPKLPSQDDTVLNTLGIMNSNTGYVSVELSPVAAVSVQLFSGDSELHVMEGKLTWTFTAPHLGYWIAAPLSPPRGISSSRQTKTKRIPAVTKKDQTTSTCDDDVFEVSSGDSRHPQDGLNQSSREKGDNLHNASVLSLHNGNVIANPGAVAIAVECNELDLINTSLPENLFFYNQPVAILHTPAFFHLEEQPGQPQWSKSATLPRAGASNGATAEPPRKDSFTQTQPKGPSTPQSQRVENEGEPGPQEDSQVDTPASPSRSHFSLPESASVPGTLSKMTGSRHSVHAFGDLSKIPSLQPPRAWFVSLEGKPAAEIHYAVTEQQRRRRPADSRETSLDSGVDMSELNQTSGRRAVTLERNNTFVKSTSSSKNTQPQ